MTPLRSNRLFLLLMALAVVSAVLIPNRVSDRGRAHVGALFAPVALPTRWLVASAHQFLWPPQVRDESSPDRPRPQDAVLAENDRLRVELANLAGQLERYRLLAGDREAMGAIGGRCDRLSVIGADSGARRTLNLVGRASARLRPGMAVLAPGSPPCVIGRVQAAGLAGAQVLLLTDKQSVFTGSFGRTVSDDLGRPSFTPLSAHPTLIAGTGGRTLRSDKLAMKDVESAGLQVGDWLVLNDAAWPEELTWYRVGRVTRIAPSKANLLFAEIEIEPVVDATQLRDVMVLSK